jgi:hypothetical protein
MPGGRIDDGFSTLVSFASNPGLLLWIKTVKPPGMIGGGKVATTTMHNNRIRTFSPKQLIEFTDGEMKAAYDPQVYAQIPSVMQVLDDITVTFADNSTLTFSGWLEEFQPDDITEGEQPVASVKFCTAGQDENGNEEMPVYGSGS